MGYTEYVLGQVSRSDGGQKSALMTSYFDDHVSNFWQQAGELDKWLLHGNGRTIRMASGRYVAPLQFTWQDFDPTDVANSLSKLARYNGHTKTVAPYTVAQHCVDGAKVMLSDEYQSMTGLSREQVEQLALGFLLHDASEAYFGDLPRPIKRSLPDYVIAEEACQKVIAELHGIKFPFDKRIEQMDFFMLKSEFFCMFLGGEGLESPMSSGDAYVEWLGMYDRLWMSRAVVLANGVTVRV